METTSFKIYLQNELVRRCDKNSQYSLRSFAKSLDIEVSSLSQILRGKRKLTSKMTKKLSMKLDLDPMTVESFIEVKDSEQKDEFRELTTDLFIVLSD